MTSMYLLPTGLAVALAAMTGEAAADPERGRRLAERWCSSCHMIDAGAPGSDAAPSFAQIARDPNRPEGWIRLWLSDPHPPMPDFNLTRDEIQDVIDYLATLAP